MNIDPLCLNPAYSTTRQVTRQRPVYEKKPDDKFESVLHRYELSLMSKKFFTDKFVQTAMRIAAGVGEILILGRLDIFSDWVWIPDYLCAT